MIYRQILCVIFLTGLHCYGFLANYGTSHSWVGEDQSSRRRFSVDSSTFRKAYLVSTTGSTTTIDEGSFTDLLLDHLRRNDTSPITFQGYVISKRSLGKQLVFCDFQTNSGDLCQAMIRQEYFTGQNFAGYKRCLLRGTKLRVTGIASPTRNPGNVVLLVQSIQLLGLPRQTQHIQIILLQAKEGAIPIEEVTQASCQDQLLLTPSNNELSEKQWMKKLAKDILESVPEDPNYPAAVDEKILAKNGNFIVPRAPNEFQSVPREILQKGMDDPIDEKSTVEEALAAMQKFSSTRISVGGWVQNRRRFVGSISQITLVDNLTLLSEDTSDVKLIASNRLVCIVHPDALDTAALYRNLMSVGAKVSVQGIVQLSRYLGKPVLWVEHLRLVQSSPRTVTIRHLLDLFHEGKIDQDDVADALLISDDEAKQLRTMDATERTWRANQLALQLQEASENKQRRVLQPSLLNVMEGYRHIAERHPVIPTRIEHIVQPKLMPIGIPGSKWQSKKKPQLEWMEQQIRCVLESHPDYGKRRLTILDIGGGKGSLANYLGQAIEDVRVHVVDIAAGAIANGEQKAKRLNVPVEFQMADASSSTLIEEVSADVVVALHACGHLSDVALAHAIQRRAGFVIAPCCFNSNPHLKIPPSGETVPEWLGVPPEDWSALKLLAEVQGDIPLASEAIGIICAVRAEAAKSKLEESDAMVANTKPKIKIRSFPIQYSTRNTVLVGMCS